MAIQLRRGAYSDLDGNALLDAEMCATLSGDPNSTDGRALYVKNGTLKQVVTMDILEGSGALDYENLSNKPQINGETLTGNVSLNTLGIQPKLTAGSNITISGSTISATNTTYSAGNGIQISNGSVSVDLSTANDILGFASGKLVASANNIGLNTNVRSKLVNTSVNGALASKSYVDTALGNKQDKFQVGGGLKLEDIPSVSYDALVVNCGDGLQLNQDATVSAKVHSLNPLKVDSNGLYVDVSTLVNDVTFQSTMPYNSTIRQNLTSHTSANDELASKLYVDNDFEDGQTTGTQTATYQDKSNEIDVTNYAYFEATNVDYQSAWGQIRLEGKTGNRWSGGPFNVVIGSTARKIDISNYDAIVIYSNSSSATLDVEYKLTNEIVREREHKQKEEYELIASGSINSSSSASDKKTPISYEGDGYDDLFIKIVSTKADTDASDFILKVKPDSAENTSAFSTITSSGILSDSTSKDFYIKVNRILPTTCEYDIAGDYDEHKYFDLSMYPATYGNNKISTVEITTNNNFKSGNFYLYGRKRI